MWRSLWNEVVLQLCVPDTEEVNMKLCKLTGMAALIVSLVEKYFIQSWKEKTTRWKQQWRRRDVATPDFITVTFQFPCKNIMMQTKTISGIWSSWFHAHPVCTLRPESKHWKIKNNNKFLIFAEFWKNWWVDEKVHATKWMFRDDLHLAVYCRDLNMPWYIIWKQRASDGRWGGGPFINTRKKHNLAPSSRFWQVGDFERTPAWVMSLRHLPMQHRRLFFYTWLTIHILRTVVGGNATYDANQNYVIML